MTTFEDAHGMTAAAAKHESAGIMAGKFFGRMIAAMQHRARIAAVERRLRDMPDHMLKDIGMHRSEIHAVVRMGRDAYGR